MKKSQWSWFAAAMLAGCGVAQEEEQVQAADDVAQQSIQELASMPAYSNLSPLFGTMQGSPIVVSNNPENVNREGLLLATEQFTPVNLSTVRRTLSGTNLDSLCPQGSMREFSFYMHHLNDLGAGARYYVFLEPAVAGTAVQFNAFGAAITQMDTGSLNPGVGPSYAVSLALLTGTLPSWVTQTNGSRFVNVAGATVTSRYTLVNLAATTGSSVDARIKVRSTNGQCLRVRVVAAGPANASEQLASDLGRRQFAWGNTAAPCVATSSAWGRPAGTYRFDQWVGSTNVAITTASSTQGWRFLAAPANVESGTSCTPPSGSAPAPSGDNQRAPALGYYSTNTSGATEGRDSDPFSTANYGAEYRMTYRVTNNSGQCVNARLLMTSYPGTRRCQDVALADSKSRHYDGAARVTQSGVALAPVRLFTKCPDGALASTIVSRQLIAGETVTWDVQLFIPGLISIPGAVLLNTCPCGQTCN